MAKARKNIVRPEVGTIKKLDEKAGDGIIVDANGRSVYFRIKDERYVLKRRDGNAFFEAFVVSEVPAGAGDPVIFYREAGENRVQRAPLWGIQPAWHKREFTPATAEQLAAVKLHLAVA